MGAYRAISEILTDAYGTACMSVPEKHRRKMCYKIRFIPDYIKIFPPLTQLFSYNKPPVNTRTTEPVTG